MEARNVLFAGGPCHGEVRAVDSTWYRVPMLSNLTAGVNKPIRLEDIQIETFEYRMEPFGVCNRVVWLMVPARATANSNEEAVCSVLLSGRALDCSELVKR